ncbi:DNA-directed RNA polymerase I and III subunit-like [Raphidocelis subcapitata]|uniref:DNA-directed RNA polymerases I and III subunit RPAC2 n=1 Tax=Raphidocelis subcapitata TaxID=307507 RepID=A0A2V0P0M8_9CHLO|nr:DNA-directed RNA polymerase I and III subunit-like [Raphidocelis subcapitata]|eukprot:GBF93424.1 DNA-directed RNA polymerase I and III subunit-like [Raphidocelis subcapitata]
MAEQQPGPSGAETYTGTTFAIEDEDHTLANSLRFFLNKNPNVAFCGYSIPHPTEHVVNLRVQTTGEVTAAAAVRSACADLKQVCAHVGGVFDAAVAEFKARPAE